MDDRDLVPIQPEPDREIVSLRRLTQDTVTEARERVRIVEQLKAVAIGYTSAAHWTDFGGKPYLDERGCMRFAEVYGVGFTDIAVEQIQYEDERGRVVDFAVTCRAHWQGRVVESDGGRSTKDQFWNGTEEHVDENGETKTRPRRLPLSEIDVSKVRRAAVTNAKARATKAILSLSFTWDEVKAGLERAHKAADVTRVEFGGKTAAKKATGVGEMNETKEEIRNLILQYTDGDRKEARSILETLTTFKGRSGQMVKGKSEVKDLSDKQAAVVLERVRKECAINFTEEETAP